MQATRIYNDLYVSHKVSAFELAHGFRCPLIGQPMSLPQELFDAQVTLQAKRKLSRFIASKYIATFKLCPGDMFDVFLKNPS